MNGSRYPPPRQSTTRSSLPHVSLLRSATCSRLSLTGPFHLCEDYVIPNPKGDWSYLAYSGNGFKIDHVMHTLAVEVTQVEYLDWIRGRFLAGEKIKKPVSDHAVLRFEVL